MHLLRVLEAAERQEQFDRNNPGDYYVTAIYAADDLDLIALVPVRSCEKSYDVMTLTDTGSVVLAALRAAGPNDDNPPA